MGRSEVDLLFYPRGSEPLLITTPPPHEDQAVDPREKNDETSQASEEHHGIPQPKTLGGKLRVRT